MEAGYCGLFDSCSMFIKHKRQFGLANGLLGWDVHAKSTSTCVIVYIDSCVLGRVDMVIIFGSRTLMAVMLITEVTCSPFHADQVCFLSQTAEKCNKYPRKLVAPCDHRLFQWC